MALDILVLPGSLRHGSFNRKLAAEAVRRLALTDANVTLLSLADYPLPIYDADLEAEKGIPENALLLAQRIAAQDGLLLVSPEYNAGVPPLLKNAIDWASRVKKVRGRPVQPFSKLVVGLASASPGRLGSMRSLAAWRLSLMALGAEVVTAQVTLANAGAAFDDEGGLLDDHASMALDTLTSSLLDHVRAVGRHG
ncbi:NADPH-dependent FMN reductase [Consotaella salsifontis]|uniref:NAD(P)H-dependent FMN reductase n=1 Tax=Consotaella salsifontis TaxID=1365950 RepID=A0A1T4T8W5_9HYPH|nr:NAD(P)H-dependent oxidoreductase [Consotaella salsifontis]SKA36751.1 NAD(P)H-dependent FMN reductase [Consotaella salsifontis]